MMTYIPPTGTIQMLAGVHLNPKQEDTLWYDTTAGRDAAFDSFVYATYTEQSYSRPTRNSVKIQDTADRLYKCSYMRFKNGAAFGGQWIYCFVLAVEYVNNNTCEVFYEIDDMITWFPQCELRQCFVEREIPETDNWYENLIDENIETGEYTVIRNGVYDMNEDMQFLFQATVNADKEMSTGVINGLSTPIHYFKLPVNATSRSFEEIVKLITNDYAQIDNLLNVQIVPYIVGKTAVPEPSDTAGQKTVETDEFMVDLLYALDGYIPKNKKLYTYPYCFLQMSNYSGQLVTYRWENFSHGTQTPFGATFDVMAIALGNPTVLCIPRNYRGLTQDYENALTLTNFPPMPWVCDTYKAYLAQNKASIMTSILSTVVGSLFGISSNINHAIGQQAINNNTPNNLPTLQISSEMNRNSAIIGAVQNAVGTGLKIAESMAKLHDIQNSSPKSISTLAQSDMFTMVADRCGFYGYNCTIKKEYAKSIDEYFSAYGYAQHKVKIPNTHSRPFWNYTKTQGCIVVGDVPADALARISAIFDKGIRFWKRNSDIGDYSLNNSV